MRSDSPHTELHGFGCAADGHLRGAATASGFGARKDLKATVRLALEAFTTYAWRPRDAQVHECRSPRLSISMSAWRDVIVGLGLYALTACNFTPVYAPDGAGYELAGSILVQEPESENDYYFAIRIEERLGRSNGARYRLNYRINTSTEGVGRTLEQQITRFNIAGTAEYQVVDAATGDIVDSGAVDSITGYSATIPLANARAATRDANRRLMTILADQVAVRVLASFGRWRE